MSILPSSPVILTYGVSGSVALEGTVTPAPAEGTTVTVFSNPYPYTSASPILETTTNVDGRWEATVAAGLTQNTRLYGYWSGTPTVASARSADVQVNVRVRVTTRRLRTVVYRFSRNRRLRYQTLTAIVQPAHGGRVTFYVYWAYRGRWRRIRMISPWLSNAGAYSYARYTFWPPYPGYYKVRSRYAGDANHWANYSPYVMFRAR
jgi:hypothetical protein